MPVLLRRHTTSSSARRTCAANRCRNRGRHAAPASQPTTDRKGYLHERVAPVTVGVRRQIASAACCRPPRQSEYRAAVDIEVMRPGPGDQLSRGRRASEQPLAPRARRALDLVGDPAFGEPARASRPSTGTICYAPATARDSDHSPRDALEMFGQMSRGRDADVHVVIIPVPGLVRDYFLRLLPQRLQRDGRLAGRAPRRMPERRRPPKEPLRCCPGEAGRCRTTSATFQGHLSRRLHRLP
jgi:hypothetical protein